MAGHGEVPERPRLTAASSITTALKMGSRVAHQALEVSGSASGLGRKGSAGGFEQEADTEAGQSDRRTDVAAMR